MVIGQNAECLICNKEYFVRVAIGLDSYQKHYFDCLDCNEPIGVAVRSKAPNAHIEAIENCQLGGFDRDKTIINLHPNFCFPADRYHSSMFFPSIDGVELLFPHMRQNEGAFHQDVASQFDIPNADAMWGKIKAIYNLSHTQGKEKTLAKLLKGHSIERSKVKGQDTSFESYIDAMIEFYDSLFYPRVNELFEPVKHLIDQLYVDGLLDEFYSYYQDNLKEEHSLRYVSVFTSYFKHRDILGQLIYRARIDNSDIDNLMVGSKNFDAIKLFYGEAYESLTSNFTTLACLNNIQSGREYDQFQRMTLTKYIKDLDKSAKDGPIKDNPIFSKFTDSLDSSLRNGSHHASIWRKDEVIMYRSGGTGQEKNISYSRYLHMCCVLTISLAALHMIELHLTSKYI